LPERISDHVPRFTRRAVALAVIAAGFGEALLRGGRRARTRSQAVVDFGQIHDGQGWGSSWHLAHYKRHLLVEGGEGVLELPAGLTTTAPDQATPILFLDHACRNFELELDFSVSNPTSRPGVILAAKSPLDYAAVTLEASRLVLAHYGRAGRHILAAADALTLRVDATYRLGVTADGSTIRAWIKGPSGRKRHLTAHNRSLGTGTHGIVLVHPTDLRHTAMHVGRFSLATDGDFTATLPSATYLLSGIPARAADSSTTVLLRVGSAFPARIRFEVLDQDVAAGWRASDWLSAERPPYTALQRVSLSIQPLLWRARLRSPTSDAEFVTETYTVTPHDERTPLVMLAASCVEFWGMEPTHGFTRMREASHARPSALVFQGDMGYANNKYHSCYLADEDYFADRFTRFLADPFFVALRRDTPVGSTMDDHDYGPRNNADRTTVKPWAIKLWNDMHADPSTTGYFDYQYGDVHCVTLDGRRYADPIWFPNRPGKTKLGARQFAWMQAILDHSDAQLFVIFSADTFASRYLRPGSTLIPDCFVGGWPEEYERAMTVFASVQETGRRVVILSGDAHSFRIHYHSPGGLSSRAAAIVEFVCSGLRPRHWFGAASGDPTLDSNRNVVGRAGGGMITVDPDGTADRRIVLRAISGESRGPTDLFTPLVLPFRPG
jgi:PhoD-like phosphatase